MPERKEGTEGPGRVFLGIGSNLGDRLALIREGLKNLQDNGVGILGISSLYETDPVGFREQGDFLNLAVEAAWPGTPRDLLKRCLEAEKGAGRVRRIRDGPRTLDVDILLCGRRILKEEGLEIPHPRLHLRRFVLVPLEEIAPDVLHPVLGLSVRELLARCPDASGVRRSPLRVSLERGDPSGYNPAASRGKDG